MCHPFTDYGPTCPIDLIYRATSVCVSHGLLQYNVDIVKLNWFTEKKHTDYIQATLLMFCAEVDPLQANVTHKHHNALYVNCKADI